MSTSQEQSLNGAFQKFRLTADMKRVINEQRLAFVATVCPDGTANVSPKGTIGVFDDFHLAFVDIRSPGTVRNLGANPSIEVNVVDPFRRKGYRFKGTGQVVRDGVLFRELTKFYAEKRVDGESQPALASSRHRRLPEDYRFRAFVLIEVEQASALISPAYDFGAREDEVHREWTQYFAALNSKRVS